MKPDPLIRANILARRLRYEEAIRILEAEEDRYYSSFTYYYLLGICYLRTRVYGKALTNFRKARDIKMREPLALLGLAALYLNKGNTDRAVDTYLEVLELDENNRIAAKALKIIRKFPGPENISNWLDSNRLHTIFPPFPKIPTAKGRPLKIIAAAAAVLVIAFGILAATGNIGFLQKNTRQTPVSLELLKDELNAPMQLEGSFRYVLTRDQINNLYNEARRLFASFHDETARVNLNKILESNGPDPVKNKARLLLSYLEVPGFDTLRDRFTYAQVTGVTDDIILYRDCHIIWRGRVANLETAQNHTSFDLLVGYDTRTILEGTVRVDFDFAVAVNPEKNVEVLGSIIPINTDKGLSIRVQGIALNQAGIIN
ncbi:MAG: tetratricopeptide repeat protein [Treponema sp.]|nr:tetratricopeptide repeat protein [Treponema sp.]